MPRRDGSLRGLPFRYPGLDLDWLLLGSHFQIDPTGRAFLLFTALLWSASGVYGGRYIADEGKERFFFFFLLTMTGNLGLTIASDVIGFYLFFALMTFAGYGLIVHTRDRESVRAGRVYVAMAVVAEGLLLAGLLLAVGEAGSIDLATLPAAIAGSDRTGAITVLLLVGFAVKAGAVPLHVWLPLAHPVAPTPASAVLSGAMIKAGLLGWLRFLPLGHSAQAGVGDVIIAMGILAAFFGVVVGLAQTEAKTVLAYSSISQMGLMNVGVGIALAQPTAAVPAIAVLTVYAVHHGVAKGALFLGVGVADSAGRGQIARVLSMAGVAFAALALVGFPLTSGYVAKSELKTLVSLAPDGWVSPLELFLPLSAAATALLMLRFLAVVRTSTRSAVGRPPLALWAPWLALLGGSAAAAWLLIGGGSPVPAPYALAQDLLPIAGGAAVFWLLGRAAPSWAAATGRPLIAPGDILHPIKAAGHALLSPFSRIGETAEIGLVPRIARRWYRLYSESDPEDRLVGAELTLTAWGAGFSLVLLLCALVLLLLATGAG